MGGLHRLVYRSLLAVPGTAEQNLALIQSILEASRRRNAMAGLTGVLLFGGETVTQVLEGPLAALEDAYDRIAADARHRAFELVQFVPIQARDFAAWTLGQVTEASLEACWEGADSPAALLAVAPERFIQRLAAALAASSDGATARAA